MMDCNLRYAHWCFVQRKFGEFYIVVSLLAQPFPHGRWPCDHPHVVLAESLPLLHMRESPHLGVLPCSGSFLRRPRSLMKPTRNEMEYAVDLSVHHMSLPFDHTFCLGKSELETCLRFPVSENRNRKLQSESSFLFPLLPRVQLGVVHQHLGLRHKQHTHSCRQHVLNLHVLVSLCSLDSLDSFWLWNFCFQWFLIFFVSHFDICTRFSNWFDSITNWCHISNQSIRWTYQRTALPSPFPDC